MTSRSATTTDGPVEVEERLPPVHPGEVLSEEFLRPLGLSARALAERIGVPPNRVSMIAAGKRGITGDTALRRLADTFGTTAEFWMNLQKPLGVGGGAGCPQERCRVRTFYGLALLVNHTFTFALHLLCPDTHAQMLA